MTSNALSLSEMRRAHERKALSIEVTLESENNFFMGLTENISEGGVFVATHSLREVGARLEVELKLPGLAEAVRLQAVVRWVRLFQEGSDVPPGLGLQFLDVPDRAARAIREFVQSRDAIFWEE